MVFSEQKNAFTIKHCKKLNCPSCTLFESYKLYQFTNNECFLSLTLLLITLCSYVGFKVVRLSIPSRYLFHKIILTPTWTGTNELAFIVDYVGKCLIIFLQYQHQNQATESGVVETHSPSKYLLAPLVFHFWLLAYQKLIFSRLLYICNIYNMASWCVSAISDLNPEIGARGEAEGCYGGVKGWYCWYTPRSHAIYNIFYT